MSRASEGEVPVGMLVFGPVADLITIETLLVLASALMAVPGLWIFFKQQPIRIPTSLASPDYEMQIGDLQELQMNSNLIARTSIRIEAPREKIWNALVDPEAIQQYMFGTQVVSEWRAGSSTSRSGNTNG